MSSYASKSFKSLNIGLSGLKLTIVFYRSKKNVHQSLFFITVDAFYCACREPHLSLMCSITPYLTRPIQVTSSDFGNSILLLDQESLIDCHSLSLSSYPQIGSLPATGEGGWRRQYCRRFLRRVEMATRGSWRMYQHKGIRPVA